MRKNKKLLLSAAVSAVILFGGISPALAVGIVLGGSFNTASGDGSSVSGGNSNIASGGQSSVSGGFSNTASGIRSSAFGGKGSIVQGDTSVGVAGGSSGADAQYGLAAGYRSVVTVANGTAVGYQATTNQDGTIAFGHDSGDVSGYTVTWQTDSNGKDDYTKDPTITENKYTSAYYNRLVKIADGVDAHDAVTVEQLNKAVAGAGSGKPILQVLTSISLLPMPFLSRRPVRLLPETLGWLLGVLSTQRPML